MKKNKKNFWPPDSLFSINSGFSDVELENLCSENQLFTDNSLTCSPIWLYWTVEIYSFGKCYREWLGLPKWFPLPLYGDHGVTFSGTYSSHEAKSKPNIHLTWFSNRFESLQLRSSKKVIHIPHPWILYRHRHKIIRQESARGTLIFYSHSNENIEIKNYDWDKYFSDLKNLPQEYHPLSICLHKHDVNKKVHQKIRKYGIPIISAGETSSSLFVDRFYDIASRFKYATSNSGGSDLFICEELGVKYFIFGESPTYFNFGDIELPVGGMKPRDDIGKEASLKKYNLFTIGSSSSQMEKKIFVTNVMGLDVDEAKAKTELLAALRKELQRHSVEVFFNILKTLLNCVKKPFYNLNRKK